MPMGPFCANKTSRQEVTQQCLANQLRLVKFNKNRLIAVNQTFEKFFHSNISTQSSVNVRGGRSADVAFG